MVEKEEGGDGGGRECVCKAAREGQGERKTIGQEDEEDRIEVSRVKDDRNNKRRRYLKVSDFCSCVFILLVFDFVFCCVSGRSPILYSFSFKPRTRHVFLSIISFSITLPKSQTQTQ